jgi:hypothetical protein
MSPFVSPISPTWMNSLGSWTKFPTSQTATTASSAQPKIAVNPDLTTRSSDCLSCAGAAMRGRT